MSKVAWIGQNGIDTFSLFIFYVVFVLVPILIVISMLIAIGEIFCMVANKYTGYTWGMRKVWNDK